MNKETARKSGAIEVLARIVNRYAEQISVCKNGISALKVLITKGISHIISFFFSGITHVYRRWS